MDEYKMDEYKMDQALQAFERIESRLVEFSRHVPIVPENATLKAPSLIPVIINACGLIDSLLRDGTPALAKVKGEMKATLSANMNETLTRK